MKKLAKRFLTLTIPYADFLAAHPELKYFDSAFHKEYLTQRMGKARHTLRKHIGFITGRRISEFQMREIKRKGELTVKRMIHQEVNPEQEQAFEAIYASLFSSRKDYGTFVKFANDKEGTGIFKVNGKEVERKLTINDVRFVRKPDAKTGKLKRELVYSGPKGVVKTTGIVHNYVHKLFYDGNGDSITGTRKGINTRLWFNVVSAQDILQMLALRVWSMILDGHELIGAGRFVKDPITLKSEDMLSRFLMTAGRNLFLNSLEIIQRNEDGDVKHKGTEKGKYSPEGIYKRNVQRIYQFSSMSELVENIDGTFRLAQAEPEEIEA